MSGQNTKRRRHAAERQAGSAGTVVLLRKVRSVGPATSVYSVVLPEYRDNDLTAESQLRMRTTGKLDATLRHLTRRMIVVEPGEVIAGGNRVALYFVHAEWPRGGGNSTELLRRIRSVMPGLLKTGGAHAWWMTDEGVDIIVTTELALAESIAQALNLPDLDELPDTTLGDRLAS